MEKLKDDSRRLAERMARSMFETQVPKDQAIQDVADLVFILWMPALDRVAENHAKTLAMLETTASACRLEVYRLRTGSYPEQLAQVGRASKDPYDGRSLKYRRVVNPAGEGYVIAAAGPQDDAEIRIRVLAEICGFDKELYERRGYGNSEAYTFGVFRRHN